MTNDATRWLDITEPGWTRVELPFPSTSSRFVTGDTTGRRLSVRFYRRDADGALMLKARCGPDAQGPPGHAHGGSMAALLDEAMGAAAWLSGHPVLAAELNVTFKRMLPLETACVVEAEVVEVDDRKIHASSVLRDPAGGIVYCTGRALLIELDERQLADLATLTMEMLDRERREAGEPDQGKGS
ncbi:PaaI family thioesterase [bacterium]|nr:PaaI family thioesterase [bacterium]MBU1073613.1 PaaI family thioesterase [bacterium]MBU1675953.1 PaaI family thioesterase [bacterium]